MKSRVSAFGLVVAIGCGQSSPADPDAGDAGPSLPTFSIQLTRGDTGKPAVGARACLRGKPTDRCVVADEVGKVRISLEPDSDHVLEISLDGYRPVLYPLHMGGLSTGRTIPLGLYTVADDVAFYAAPIDGTTGTLTLRAEASAVLAKEGKQGVTFAVVAPSGLTLRYANESASALEDGHVATTLSGLAGVAQVPPGYVDFTGRDALAASCRPWFGGFEVSVGEPPAIRVPIEAGYDTRIELRCP